MSHEQLIYEVIGIRQHFDNMREAYELIVLRSYVKTCFICSRCCTLAPIGGMHSTHIQLHVSIGEASNAASVHRSTIFYETVKMVQSNEIIGIRELHVDCELSINIKIT